MLNLLVHLNALIRAEGGVGVRPYTGNFCISDIKCKVIFLTSTFSAGLVGAPVQCAFLLVMSAASCSAFVCAMVEKPLVVDIKHVIGFLGI